MSAGGSEGIELRWAHGHREAEDSVMFLGDAKVVAAGGTLGAILDVLGATGSGGRISDVQLEALIVSADAVELVAEMEGVGGRTGDAWVRFLSVATFHGGLVARAVERRSSANRCG